MNTSFIVLFLLSFITLSCSKKIEYDENKILREHLATVLNGDTSLAEQTISRELTYTIFIDNNQIGRMETLIKDQFNVTQLIDMKDGVKTTGELTGENNGYFISEGKKRDLTKSEIVRLKLTAAYSDLLGYHKLGRLCKVVDIETVQGEPCYVIEVETESDKNVCDIYLSTVSHLILKKVENKIEIIYEDYQQNGNIYIPHTVKILSSQIVRFKVDSVVFLNT